MIIAVIYTTFTVGKRKPEKNSDLYRIRTLDLCDTSAALYQLNCRGRGNESRTSRNFFFSGFLFATAKVQCVHIIWFSYIQNFNKKLSYTLLLVLIFNNYWTRLSKIMICLWRADQLFAEAEARLRQIIDLLATDKSRCFAITEFNNCFTIRSPSLFFNNYPREAKWSAIFTQERSQEGEKHGFHYACAEYYLQPNTVGRHMRRPLFVGSYLQVMWWALGQWKERKICFEW